MNLRFWIAAGLLVVLACALNGAEKKRDHWAFQPLGRPAVPRLAPADRSRTPIDAFLLAKLNAAGLAFSADADRVTLIRRASLDLLGLPPTPQEVDAFLADRSSDAYERLLDRLLASPHFGERWGRHWLDVAGYTDTVGFDQDTNTILVAEGKWRYRDYVVAAFNSDLPFDRFVTEQLAGDELVDWRNAPHFTPEIRRLLTATGFLRTARDQTHEPESNIALNHYGVLHDTVSIVGNSLLGLTLTCAQCHSHKFDPIPQRDYYRLMAVFTPAYNPRAWRPVYPWKEGIKDRALPDASPAEMVEIDRHNRDIDRQVTQVTDQLDKLRRPTETRLRETRLQKLPESIRADTRTALDTPAEKRNDIQKYLVKKLEPLLRAAPEEVTAALKREERAQCDQFNNRISALKAARRMPPKIQALYDVGPPPSTYFLKRGNFESPGDEVEPGFLSVLSDGSQPKPVPTGQSSGRRSALARWLTDPNSRASALLSRVMVNRLWQHLFGQGLVPTPDNFGLSGEPPTHPELLEWLSGEFIRSGWRVKPLIKLMMTSTAYRQSSRAASATANADPTNRLLGRMRLRRLEAEAIRDSLLAVSGRLNVAMGGRPILVRPRSDGLVEVDDKAKASDKDRRSVYLLARRSYNLSLLTVFDQPLVAHNCPCRDVSAVPLQSLTMLNDAFVTEQARHFAERVNRSGMLTRQQTMDTAFRLALARCPTKADLEVCSRLLDRQAAAFREAGRPPADAERLALVQLCQTLLNTSEFLYVE